MGVILVILMFGGCAYVFPKLFPIQFDEQTGYGTLWHPAVIPFFVFELVATAIAFLAVNTNDLWLVTMLTFDIVATPVVAIASFVGYSRRSDSKLAAERRRNQGEWEKVRQGKNGTSSASVAGSTGAGSGFAGTAKSAGRSSAGPAYLYYGEEERHPKGNTEGYTASHYDDVDAMDDYQFGEDVSDVEDFLDWEESYTERPSHREEHYEPESRAEETGHNDYREDDFERE